MKKIISMTFALTMLLSSSTLTAFAEETPVPANVDEAVYEQLLENKWICDENSDGIITDEELAQATQLTVNLDSITDLSWLTKMPSCRYLSFKNGTLTDFSVLKELPALNSLSMNSVPVTDISFIKELNLESCRFSGMEQITPEQRMEVLRFSTPEFWAGTSGEVKCYPRGLVDYQLSIADKDVAVFMDNTTSTIYPDERIYGASAGKTAYTVSLDGKDYYTGEIIVKENPGAYNPELHNTGIEHFEVGQSKYYNPDSETGNSGLVTLVNGTLYSVRGSEIKTVETDVLDYEYIYKRSYSKSYNYADMVLKSDGTLLVNGEPITDIKVKAMREGFFLGENGYIYTIVPDGEGFTVSTVTTESKGWVDGCNPLYVTADGNLKYYSTDLIGEGKIRVFTGNTNISEPISACKFGSVCYVVSKSHTLYELSFYSSFTKTKIADDVLSVEVSADGSQVEYTKTDGTKEIIENYGAAGGYTSRAKKYLGIDAGTFYIREYQNRGIEEDDAVFDYYIDKNRTMSLSFLGNYCGLTHVEGEIGEAYDSVQDNGYVYFLRTDGSIWKYNLDTQQWQEAIAGTVPITSEKLKGDVNNDGTFNVADIILLQKWLLAVPDTHLADWKMADFCEDEKLNVFDLCLMKRELLNSK